MPNEEITLKDVYRLLQNVNSNLNERINNIEQTCKNVFTSYETEVKAITEKYISIEKENTELKRQLKSIETKLKSNNIVVYGIKEKLDETQNDLITTAQTIFEDILSIKLNISEFSNIYRIGKKKNKSRPVLISLTTYLRKTEILRSATKFKRSTFSISPDLTIQEQQERKVLVSELKKAKHEGKTASIKKIHLLWMAISTQLVN